MREIAGDEKLRLCCFEFFFAGFVIFNIADLLIIGRLGRRHAEVQTRIPAAMTIRLMPNPSRRLGGSRNILSDTTWAIGTSISASVRTGAASVSAKAMNQSCEASAPMKPANSDERQALTIARAPARSKRAR